MGVSVDVGVMLGVFVTVAVGRVPVGKGPIRTRSVIASAVLVFLAFLCNSTLLNDGVLKIT